MEYPEYLHKYIPPNFDLEKYDLASNMSLENWLVNLICRPILEKKTDLELLEAAPQYPRYSALTKDELITVLRDQQEREFRFVVESALNCGVRIPNNLNYISERISVVRDITLVDVKNCIEDLQDDSDRSNEFLELYDWDLETTADDHSKEGYYERQEKLYSFRPYPGDNNKWLSIDLECTDKEIKEAFNGWLKQTRKREKKEARKPLRREPKTNNFDIAARRKWYSNKVLPFIDLLNWNTWKGNKVTSDILGQILFPERKTGSTAMIDDTVKPLVRKLQSRIVIDRMMKVVSSQNRQKIDNNFS